MTRGSLYGLVLWAALAACNGSTPPPTSGHPPSARREKNVSCLAIAPPPPTGRVALERVFEGELGSHARLKKAIQLVQHPSQSRVWFVALQDGRLLRFVRGEEDSAEVVLDIEERVERVHIENGLMSLALHPDFEDNGYVYLVYSTEYDGYDFSSRLSRFHWDGERFDPESEHVLLDVGQVRDIHTGNHVAFGPDGYLYYALGDDKNEDRHGQDPHTVKGTLLRLDVDRRDAERETEYGIPEDNPFADGEDGAPEVYAYGFRNPWRFVFDPPTGDLYLGDVGQDSREELDRIERGQNYGWPILEGSTCFEGLPCDPEGTVLPLFDQQHPVVTSITVGPIYRGKDVPKLAGRLLYADFVTGDVWSVEPEGDEPNARMEVASGFNIPSFAQARDDRVYVLRYSTEEDGGIYEVVENEPKKSTFPDKLSKTGCFSKEDPREPAAGVLPYAPIAQLWSDGSEKHRFIALPDDGRIALANDGHFTLPDGTVLVKHFGFDDRLHETRLLMRHEGEWSGYSYRWNEEQTDAELLPASVDTVLENGVRWRYPSRGECKQCHTEAAGHTLGLEVAQLDHATRTADGERQNQLRWLLEHDYFLPELQSLKNDVRRDVARLVDPFGDGAAEARARAYLHANCSHCHRPGAQGRGDIDLRYSTPFADLDVCDEEARTQTLWGVPGDRDAQRILAPGAPVSSLIWLRMSLRGRFGMPLIASELVDEEALELVGDWIESIEDCD